MSSTPNTEQLLRALTTSGVLSAEDSHTLSDNGLASHCANAEQLAAELVRQSKLTPFQAEAVAAGEPARLTLGNYVLLEKIGEGGMGTVYKARHRRMERIVAFKILRPAAHRTPETVARFHREIKAAARLEHPNIVTAYDADEVGGVHFLVMQYVEGADLTAVVKKVGLLPIRQAVRYTIEAARGLGYAHSQGMIHRDVKPSNLLLDLKGTVKVLDLGLSRFPAEAGTATDDLTAEGALLGTPDYMAPEQADDGAHADHRADVYGLGCTLFFLLCGRPPYLAATLRGKLDAHHEQAIPSLRTCRPDVSENLDRVCRRMLAKAPADRPQTMEEVVASLEACLSNESGTEPAAVADRSGVNRHCRTL